MRSRSIRAASMAAIFMSSLAITGQALATDYPNRAVRLIVPSAAGGGTDIVARLLAQKLSQTWGQQVYVENKPGAGQMIGIDMVAKAPSDGYTLLIAASTLALNPVMYKKVPYDTVRDLAPISEIATLPNVLVVHPSVPAESVEQLLTLAKRNPGKYTYASAGVGTSPHMSMELFASMGGAEILHVPYKGTGPAVLDLLGGQVSMMMGNTLSVLPHIKAGKLRAIGVSSKTRNAALPDVPAIAEAGVPGYESVQWYGLLATAGTPQAIVEKIQSDAIRALKTEDLQRQLAVEGATAVGSTAAQFGALIKAEISKWTAVAKAAGIERQ